MPVPTPVNTVTVAVGIAEPSSWYVATYRENSQYTFYRGVNRYIAMMHEMNFGDDPSHLSMWKSPDNGETWAESDAAGAPTMGTIEVYPAYDVRMAAKLNPNSATVFSVLYQEWKHVVEPTTPRTMKFADFDFESDTWGDPYDVFDISRNAFDWELSTTPSGVKAYSISDPSGWTLFGVPLSGPSPRLLIAPGSEGQGGPQTGFGLVGNVRHVGTDIVFPRFSLDETRIEIGRGNLDLSVDAGSGPGTRVWTYETVPTATDFSARTTTLWLIAGRQIYWVGSDRESIYRSTKEGGTWGAAELIWSRSTDSNPDLDSSGSVFSLCVSQNPVLGSGDLTFEFDGLITERGTGMLTCHIEGVIPEQGPVNRYYGW